MSRKFRKKPVVIKALQWDGTNIREVLEFAGASSARFDNPTQEMVISTLEGTLHAATGDWIIKGVKGEFYPCKPDIFLATYEEVQDDPA